VSDKDDIGRKKKKEEEDLQRSQLSLPALLLDLWFPFLPGSTGL
jgi:hypothetical protein